MVQLDNFNLYWKDLLELAVFYDRLFRNSNTGWARLHGIISALFIKKLINPVLSKIGL